MLHSLNLASPDDHRRVGSETKSVGEPKRRPERVLLEIQRYFGCGTLRPDRSDRALKWEVRSLPLLVARIIPHFVQYPILSGKRKDFELFADICRRMVEGQHRSVTGLCEIVRLAGAMNPSGTRGYMPATIIEALMR